MHITFIHEPFKTTYKQRTHFVPSVDKTEDFFSRWTFSRYSVACSSEGPRASKRLGSSTKNSSTMRACGPFLLRKYDIRAALQADIHAVDFMLVERK